MNWKTIAASLGILTLSFGSVFAQGNRPQSANESPTVDNTTTRPNDPYRSPTGPGDPANSSLNNPSARPGTPGTENRGGISGNTHTNTPPAGTTNGLGGTGSTMGSGGTGSTSSGGR